MIKYETIPHELRLLDQWVVWKLEEIEGGKPTKIPYNARTNYPADVTKRQSYSTFADACKAEAEQGYNGIGFVFTDSDPFCGIDLDHLENDSEGQARQELVFQKMDSWSERSPSGQGLHIFVKAKIPHGRKRHGIEVYSSNRFFTVTGDTFHNVPIADRQELVNLLWSEMGQAAQENFYAGDFTQHLEDQEIFERASRAANGDLFLQLWNGDTSGYVGNSEADFALIDIIAYYTKHRIQIQRMFLTSQLGKREKYAIAKPSRLNTLIGYMVNKSFDRMLPPIDLSGVIDQFNAALAARPAGGPIGPGDAEKPRAAIGADLSPPALYDGMDFDYWRRIHPPGIMGALVNYVSAASPRPVYEISLCAAIGLMAGITGRAYNVSGTGLNHYVMCLAGTGTGKEAMSTAINRLMTAVSAEMPSALEFIGPADLASGQGLLKHLSERGTPCFVSLVGEVGLRLQQITARDASSSEIALRRVMLDLYGKSAAGTMVHPTVYSDKKNNTDVIHSPSFSILGDSTPETFYKALDEDSVSQGLLPRFLIVEYTGPRVALNPNHHYATAPMELVSTISNLAKNCHEMMATGKVITVGETADALELLNHADAYSTAKLNSADKDVIKQLWNRFHLKTYKLAALLAISQSIYEPIIDAAMVQWARSLVLSDTLRLLHKFESGQIGTQNENSEQDRAIIAAISYYLTNPFYPTMKSYGVKADMHDAKIVPYAYIQRKLVSMACFRNDKRNSTAAIQAATKNLIDSGEIAEVPPAQLRETYKFNGRAYAVLNMSIFL